MMMIKSSWPARGGFGGGSVGTAFPRPKSWERSDLPMQRVPPVFLKNSSVHGREQPVYKSATLSYVGHEK